MAIRGKDYIDYLAEQDIIPKNTVRIIIDALFYRDTMLYFELSNGKVFKRKMERSTTTPSGDDTLVALGKLGLFDLEQDLIQRVVIHTTRDDVFTVYIQRVADQRIEDLSFGDFSEPEEVISIQPSIDITMSPMPGIDYLTDEAMDRIAQRIMDYPISR